MALSDAIRETRNRLALEGQGGLTMDAEAVASLLATLAFWETEAGNLEHGVEIARTLVAARTDNVVAIEPPATPVPVFPAPQRNAS